MSKFVLTAQLQLQAPTNTRQVINQLRSQLEGQINIPVSVTGGTQATRQIKEVTKRTREATTAADKMGKAFGASIKKFAAFNIATRAVGLLASKLSSAVDEAIEFQRQLVKISQVTGKTTGQLSGLTQEITRLSTTLGVSSTSLLQTTRVLAQAGIKAGDLKVALEALAKTTLAPTFDDITETAEGAVAILAQFGEGVGALEKQLGAINAVSKQFAVESGDLISSVRRMGGVFKSAGGDLNELIGLFTSVRATTRENAESIATGLRTIFTRIQRPTTIAYLKQLGVELTDLDGKFVGPFEAVKRLSQAFADIPAGDLRFVQIAEELGGFRQIGKVIPLIQQFTIAERARQAAIAGGDSLNKDAITAQQALAVQIEKTREKFLALIRGISETSSFQIMIKSLLGMANAFIKVAESIKPLIPLITVFAGLKLAKGIGGFARGLGAGVRGKNQGGQIHAFARGGTVPGSGNRDTVPAMLTPGEFVIRKSSVKKIGAGTLAAMNENKYGEGGITKNITAFKTSQIQSLILRKQKTPGKAKKVPFDKDEHQFTENDNVTGNIIQKPITPRESSVENFIARGKKGKSKFAKANFDPKNLKRNNRPAKQGDAFEEYLRFTKTLGGKHSEFGGSAALDGTARGGLLAEVKRTKVSDSLILDKALRHEIEFGGKLSNQELSGKFSKPDEVILPNVVEFTLSDAWKNKQKRKRKKGTTRQKGVNRLGMEELPAFFGGPIRNYANAGRVLPLTPIESSRLKRLNAKGKKATPEEKKDRGILDKRFKEAGVGKQKEVDSGRSYGAAYLEKVTSPKGGKSSITFPKSKGKEEVKVNYDLNHAFLDPKDGQKIKDEFVTPKALSAINKTASHLAGIIGESIADSDNIPNLQAITGSIFEAGLSRVSKQNLASGGDVDDKRTFDFAGGLKGAAKIFGADGAKLSNIKTDAKVASTSSAVDSVRKKVKTDLEEARESGALKFAKGGSVSDTVPAMLTPGEFVINKKASQSIGYANLNRMNKQGVVGYANGGAVGVQYFAEGSNGNGVQELGFSAIAANAKEAAEALASLTKKAEEDPHSVTRSEKTTAIQNRDTTQKTLEDAQAKKAEAKRRKELDANKEGTTRSGSKRKKTEESRAKAKDDCKCEKMAAADCKCEYEAAQRIVAAIANSTGKIVVAIQKSGGGPVETVKPQEAKKEAEVQVEERREERKEERKETDDKKDDKKESGGFGKAEKFLLIAGAASATMASFADETTEGGKTMIEFNNAALAAGTAFAAVTTANKAAVEAMDRWVDAADKKAADNEAEQSKQRELQTEGVVEQHKAQEQIDEGITERFNAGRERIVNKEKAAETSATLETAETDKRRKAEALETAREARSRLNFEISTGEGPTGSAATVAANKLEADVRIAETAFEDSAAAAKTAADAHAVNTEAVRSSEEAVAAAGKKRAEGRRKLVAGKEKEAAATTKLTQAISKAPGALRRFTTGAMRMVNRMQKAAAGAAAFGVAAISAAKSLLDSFEKSSKDREADAIKEGDFTSAREEFKNQQSIGAGQDVLGKAAMGAMLGSIFGPLGTVVGGLIGVFLGLMDVVERITNIEKAREKQNQKIADAAIAQSKEKNVDLEKAFLGKGSKIGQAKFAGMEGAEKRERFAQEAGIISRKAGTEVDKVKDPKEKQKRVEQLAAEEVRMVGIIASRATTEEEAIAAIAGFDDGVGATKDELIKAAKASYALAAAQRALTKANYDSLKVTSTFNAANLALKGFVSSLDSGTSSLDGYIEIIEASQKNLGIDASASIEKAATELASNPNLSQGAKDTIDRQKETALKVNDFGLKIGQEIQNLDLSATSPEEAKAQLESKLIGAAGGDKDLEAVIRSELANVQGSVADADISTIISGIQAKAGQLSAGFIESAKIMNDSNKIITDLTNKRRASELKLIETQKQAIETQIEASKIIAEFGGDKFTPQQETAARIKQFNLSSRDAGVGGLTTGSAVDIGNLSAQLQAEFKNQQGRVINQAAGGARAFGEPTQQIDEDKRKELASAQKELIGFTKQRVAQLREELSIIQKKNKLEKDSLEALVTGDIEGFLKGQAAAGAGAAIRSGNTSLLGNFSADAIGKAFQDAKASGLTGDDLREFSEASLNARGITSTSSIDTLAGTTGEEQAIMEEGRRLGQVLGGLADQLVELDSMNVTAANVTIQTANRKRDQAIQKQNALFSSGGVVYANRGIFVPRGTDTVPAMLTPGEFVVNRASVQRGNNLAILQAMNNGQQAAPGPAMNRGGSVRYYNNGSDGGVQPGGGGFSISPETVTSLNNAFSGFSTAVDKLVGMQLSVKLDATNVNVNFSGTSFLSKLTETIRTEVLAEVKNQIPNISQNTSGGFGVEQTVL